MTGGRTLELITVRHALPDRSGNAGDPADPGLSEIGRRQAESLAGWLANRPGPAPDRVVASSLRRARETAEIVAERFGVTVEVEPRIAEFDSGATEYVPIETLGPDRLAVIDHALHTGEWGDFRFDPAAFRQRVREGFERLLADELSTRVVAICHGGVLNSYLGDVLQRPYGVFFHPHYTSVHRLLLRRSDGRLMIESLNEIPHAVTDPDLTF